jgi:predicted DNA-binding transcriptional regulator AlpA
VPPPSDWTTWTFPGPPGLLYTRKQVAALLDLSERTIDRMAEEGRFPVGIRPSPQSPPMWSGADLAAWLHLAARLCRTTEDTPPSQPDNG